MRQHPSVRLRFREQKDSQPVDFSHVSVHGLNTKYSKAWATVLSAEYKRQASHRMRVQHCEDIAIYSHTGRSVHAKLEGCEWRFYTCKEGGTMPERILIAVAAQLLRGKMIEGEDQHLALAHAKESHRIALAACTKSQLPKELRQAARRYSA